MIAYVPHLAEGLPYDPDDTGTPCEVPARIEGPHPEDEETRRMRMPARDDDALRALRAKGWSFTRIARWVGLTRGAVQYRVGR